jgi:hypothetical protein
MRGRLIEPLGAPDYTPVNGQSPRWRTMTAFAPHPFWRRSRSRSSKIAKFASNAFNVSSAPDVEAPAALSQGDQLALSSDYPALFGDVPDDKLQIGMIGAHWMPA